MRQVMPFLTNPYRRSCLTDPQTLQSVDAAEPMHSVRKQAQYVGRGNNVVDRSDSCIVRQLDVADRSDCETGECLPGANLIDLSAHTLTHTHTYRSLHNYQTITVSIM